MDGSWWRDQQIKSTNDSGKQMCVCVCVRERERERERDAHLFSLFFDF